MDGAVVTHAAETAAHGGVDLFQVVALLAAGVIAVPIFRRLGLGSVLGYLAAGLAVGPFGFGVVADPQAVLHAAEIGVVLFLFIVGLEMEPSRLWALRKQIFGLGVMQVALCGALLTVLGIFVLGLSPPVAFVGGMGFVMTSTAIVMQILAERGELQSPAGQKIVSVLLLEDLAIVPLLAVVALLSPVGGQGGGDALSRWIAVGIAAASIVTVVFAGRWVLNPVFRILADSKAREVMTAAALLVVLGAALIMEAGGLSMAMGAFLAGVLLSTSTFRHQLEADVEPFRGLLLGLFFLAVGMSLDLTVVAQNWQFVGLAVLGYMVVKGLAIYGLARVMGGGHAMALERALLMAQGGEFAFVLYTTAVAGGIFDAEVNAILTATVIISMVLTPFSMIALKFLPKPAPSMEGVEAVPEGLTARVLLIGFGRFGQIASQPLIAKGFEISIIDNDTEMIQVAQTFGFKLYYGDGTRLDILHAAGAANADVVLVAVDRRESATRIVELLKSEFPLVKIMARAFDRGHALELLKAGADYQLREVFESAIAFGADTLRMLGTDEDEITTVVEGVRERDRQRFAAQMVGGLMAGRDLLIANAEDQARESGTVKGPSTPIIAPPDGAEEETAKV